MVAYGVCLLKRLARKYNCQRRFGSDVAARFNVHHVSAIGRESMMVEGIWKEGACQTGYVVI